MKSLSSNLAPKFPFANQLGKQSHSWDSKLILERDLIASSNLIIFDSLYWYSLQFRIVIKTAYSLVKCLVELVRSLVQTMSTRAIDWIRDYDLKVHLLMIIFLNFFPPRGKVFYCAVILPCLWHSGPISIRLASESVPLESDRDKFKKKGGGESVLSRVAATGVAYVTSVFTKTNKVPIHSYSYCGRPYNIMYFDLLECRDCQARRMFWQLIR